MVLSNAVDVPVAYSLASLSIVLNCFSVYYILHIRAKSITTRSILYLHITQIMYMVFTLPNVYAYPRALCKIAGFLRFYMSFSNICANTSIIVTLYNTLFNVTFSPSYKDTNKHFQLEVFVFALPLITVLPFIDDCYG